MAVSRYTRTPILDYGRHFGTSEAVNAIRSNIANGTLKTKEIVLRGAERLDTLSGVIYGDSRYWWILAAASGIGWGMQLPPGTIIKIPELGSVIRIIG